MKGQLAERAWPGCVRVSESQRVQSTDGARDAVIGASAESFVTAPFQELERHHDEDALLAKQEVAESSRRVTGPGRGGLFVDRRSWRIGRAGQGETEQNLEGKAPHCALLAGDDAVSQLLCLVVCSLARALYDQQASDASSSTGPNWRRVRLD